MTDLVDRLRERARAGYAHDELDEEAADEIERLRAALQRIDGINDNPAKFNGDIEKVLRAVLDEQSNPPERGASGQHVPPK